MSDILTTLKRKGDSSVNIYPNIQNGNIPSGAITSDKLASSSVTASKIGSGAVTTAKIGDGAVTTAKIGDNVITTTKIANGSVTGAKIGDGAVTSSKLNVRKWLQHYRLDLGDLDLSSYGLSGGSVTFYYKSYDTTQKELNDLFEDLLANNFNYIVGGYFISNNIYYNIMEFSIKYENDEYYVSLFGVANGGTKRVNILCSDIYGVVTDYSYGSNI